MWLGDNGMQGMSYQALSQAIFAYLNTTQLNKEQLLPEWMLQPNPQRPQCAVSPQTTSAPDLHTQMGTTCLGYPQVHNLQRK
jgi:hypothetical protein